MTRRYVLLVVGLLGSTLFVPFVAVADFGLTVLVFVTPPGAHVNDTVDVNVEVYQWNVLVDAFAIAGTAGNFDTALNFTHGSTGKYHATYTIEEGAASYGTLTVTVQATANSVADTGRGFYAIPSTTPPPASWSVHTRVANMAEIGMSPDPGETVVVEARSYLGVALADGGPINASASHYEGPSLQTVPLNGSKLSAGVYRFSYTVPAAITTSTYYEIDATLGSGIFAPSDSEAFSVDPIPVMVYIAAQASTSASLRVYVGNDTAVAGASVGLAGEGIIFTPPYIVTVGPFNATTSAAGFASIDATWAASSFLSFTLTVSSGGKTTTMPLYFGSTPPGGWQPFPNSPFGCSLRIQSDPSTIQPGQTATLRFRLASDGIAVASREVTRWVWRDNVATGPEQSGNVTTDATGNFTVTYAVPADFTPSDTLVVMALCPSGATSNVDVQIPSTFGSGGRLGVTVGAAAAGGSIPVTATLAGTSVPDGAYAFATIVPGSNTSAALASQNTHLPSAELTRSGATFTGSVPVPAWLPAGDFVLMVTVSNRGAASNSSQEATFTNASVVPVAPGAQTSSTPAPKGFLPGFEGAAAAAAIGVGAALVLGGRRRRAA